MGLMPDQFWSLLYKEFWIKHAAFSRAEDRAESGLIRQALRLGNYSKVNRSQMQRAANLLKRYPVKEWLKSSSS